LLIYCFSILNQLDIIATFDICISFFQISIACNVNSKIFENHNLINIFIAYLLFSLQRLNSLMISDWIFLTNMDMLYFFVVNSNLYRSFCKLFSSSDIITASLQQIIYIFLFFILYFLSALFISLIILLIMMLNNIGLPLCLIPVETSIFFVKLFLIFIMCYCRLNNQLNKHRIKHQFINDYHERFSFWLL